NPYSPRSPMFARKALALVSLVVFSSMAACAVESAAAPEETTAQDSESAELRSQFAHEYIKVNLGSKPEKTNGLAALSLKANGRYTATFTDGSSDCGHWRTLSSRSSNDGYKDRAVRLESTTGSVVEIMLMLTYVQQGFIVQVAKESPEKDRRFA